VASRVIASQGCRDRVTRHMQSLESRMRAPDHQSGFQRETCPQSLPLRPVGQRLQVAIS
jgi:hypothetical protein